MNRGEACATLIVCQGRPPIEQRQDRLYGRSLGMLRVFSALVGLCRARQTGWFVPGHRFALYRCALPTCPIQEQLQREVEEYQKDFQNYSAVSASGLPFHSLQDSL